MTIGDVRGFSITLHPLPLGEGDLYGADLLLNLERPMAFIDLQSTGLDPRTARILALSVLRVEPDGSRRARRELVDPGVPIPPGATAIHGITDEDVAGRPPFRAYARGLYEYLKGCDLAGFGIERFDLPLLKAELERAGVRAEFEGVAVIDALSLFHLKEPRDRQAAYRRFVGGEAPPDLDGAGIAMAILEGQLVVYRDLPRDVEGLRAVLRPGGDDALDPEGRFVWNGGSALVNFGRYRGEHLAAVAERDPGYLAWVAENDSFSVGSRQIAADALRGRFPEREAEPTGEQEGGA